MLADNGCRPSTPWNPASYLELRHLQADVLRHTLHVGPGVEGRPGEAARLGKAAGMKMRMAGMCVVDGREIQQGVGALPSDGCSKQGSLRPTHLGRIWLIWRTTVLDSITRLSHWLCWLAHSISHQAPATAFTLKPIWSSIDRSSGGDTTLTLATCGGASTGFVLVWARSAKLVAAQPPPGQARLHLCAAPLPWR